MPEAIEYWESEVTVKVKFDMPGLSFGDMGLFVTAFNEVFTSALTFASATTDPIQFELRVTEMRYGSFTFWLKARTKGRPKKPLTVAAVALAAFLTGGCVSTAAKRPLPERPALQAPKSPEAEQKFVKKNATAFGIIASDPRGFTLEIDVDTYSCRVFKLDNRVEEQIQTITRIVEQLPSGERVEMMTVIQQVRIELTELQVPPKTTLTDQLLKLMVIPGVLAAIFKLYEILGGDPKVLEKVLAKKKRDEEDAANAAAITKIEEDISKGIGPGHKVPKPLDLRKKRKPNSGADKGTDDGSGSR
jgi:hypothetical protein